MQSDYAIRTLTLLAAIAALTGCGPQKTSDESITKLMYPQLIEMIDAGGEQAPILVDVRIPDDYRRGHIPGAVNIPYTRLTRDHPLLEAERPIVVYSEGWTDALSASAAKKLMAMGVDHDRVYDFRGGVDYWVKQGGDLVESDRAGGA